MSIFKPARAAGSRAKFALLLGGLAGLMAVGAAGAAVPDSDLPSVVVKYSQETLASKVGVNDLYRRITFAARQVCPDAASIRDLAAQRQVEACRNQAVARAIQQIDNPSLAALHAIHSKNG
jgi:UrcA family protein